MHVAIRSAAVVTVTALLAACQAFGALLAPQTGDPGQKAQTPKTEPKDSPGSNGDLSSKPDPKPEQAAEPVKSTLLGIPVRTTVKEVKYLGAGRLEIVAAVADYKGGAIAGLPSGHFGVRVSTMAAAGTLETAKDEGNGLYRIVAGFGANTEYTLRAGSVSVSVNDLFEAFPLGGVVPTPAPGARDLVLIAVNFSSTISSRSVTVKNLGSAEIDLNVHVISYEYSASGQLYMQHLRFGKDKKMAAGASFTFTDMSGCTDGTCVYKDAATSLGGTGAGTLGIQALQGSMVLYKSVKAAADIKDANATDYLQYGSKPANDWTHVSLASSVLWDGKDRYAPFGAADKTLTVKTTGAVGSANWELK